MIKQWKIAFANYLNLYACSKQEKPKFSWYYIIAQSTASLSHGVTPLCHAKSWLLEDARLLQLCTAENRQKNSAQCPSKMATVFAQSFMIFHSVSLEVFLFNAVICSKRSTNEGVWEEDLNLFFRDIGKIKSCFYTLFLEKNLLWLSI